MAIILTDCNALPCHDSTSHQLVGYQISKCNCLGSCHNFARLYNEVAFAYSTPCDALHFVVFFILV